MQSPTRRRRRERRRDMMIAATVFALVCAAAIGGLWMLGRSAAVGPFACAGYDFTRHDWRAADPVDRRNQARLITRCNYLVGKTRKQVRADLGDPATGASDRRAWRFFIGRANDFLRLGDRGHLIVRFNRSGRVASAELPGSGS